jgi:hypothetical protein
LWGGDGEGGCRRAKRGSETGRGDPRQIASSRPQVHTAPMAIHSFGKRNSTDLKVRFDGHFADGQTASLVVSENTVLHGNRVVLDIAHE